MIRKEMLYNREAIAQVDEAAIDGMVDRLISEGLGKCALCLHRSPQDLVHEMLNVFRRDFYVPPHRHPLKSETKTILRGRLLIIIFDEIGTVCRRITLGDPATNTRIVRVEKNIYHTNIPLDDVVVFMETVTGPFLGPEDNQFAPWAPTEADPQADAYKRQLEQAG